MANTQQATWDDWVGADVVDQENQKIGTLSAVYMDRGTGKPEWMAVKTGMFGMRDTFIPIEGAGSDGDVLKVPFTKGHVKDAPNVKADDWDLPAEEEQKLYQYYGRKDYKAWDDSSDRDVTPGQAQTATTDTGRSGGGRDDAMTRSEEELVAGTRSKEAGRVRLRKYVVTENVTTTVPVRKEKVRLEREPITDANVDQATKGAEISEGEHEVVLKEEEVVTEKRTVPKERVRLEKDVETEQREVSDEVRKEKIDVDDDAGVTDKGRSDKRK